MIEKLIQNIFHRFGLHVSRDEDYLFIVVE